MMCLLGCLAPRLGWEEVPVELRTFWTVGEVVSKTVQN
jgi:hypothetical protein